MAAQVHDWIEAGRPVTLARVFETRGFSTREPAAAIAGTPGAAPVGGLASAATAERVGEILADPTPRVAELVVTDEDAVAAGLACGGVARLLVTDAEAASLWPRLLDREPVCLVTEVSAQDAVGATVLLTRADAGAADPEVRSRFARGISETVRLPDRIVTTLWPVPRVVLVGSDAVAQAVAAQARLLGWNPLVLPDAASAEAHIAALSPADGVVVTSHDLALSGSALAAALRGRAGYVGALGSRRTQQARRDWLADHGIEDVSAVHGPAGLDLGATTPAEIALAITAEMVANRSGASAGPLRNRTGPIHS